MIIHRYKIKLFGRDMIAWGDDERVYAISLFNDMTVETKLSPFADNIETGDPGDLIPSALKLYEATSSIKNLDPVILWGTPFQRKVWEELYRLPRGELITYGELAAKIGKPRAARAVGSAVGANHIAIVIPCHRVVGKNGPGGFGGDLELKRKLLETEGLRLPD